MPECKSSDEFLTCLVNYFIVQNFKEITRETAILDVILTNKEGCLVERTVGSNELITSESTKPREK